jgi:hypothetical protein
MFVVDKALKASGGDPDADAESHLHLSSHS